MSTVLVDKVMEHDEVVNRAAEILERLRELTSASESS